MIEKSAQENSLEFSPLNVSFIKNDENRLRYQIAELEVSSPENIVEKLCYGNIDEVCDKFKSSVEIVRIAYRRTSNFKKNNLYVLLFEGIQKFYGFCHNDTLKKS